MPISKRVANFNRYVTNPLGRLIAGRRFSPLLVVEHTGRTSGKLYRTPLMGFRRGNELVIVLTYGPDVDWLKNLRAAGGGSVVLQGRRLRLGPPTVAVDLPTQRAVPGLIRLAMSLTDINSTAHFPLLATAPA